MQIKESEIQELLKTLKIELSEFKRFLRVNSDTINLTMQSMMSRIDTLKTLGIIPNRLLTPQEAIAYLEKKYSK